MCFLPTASVFCGHEILANVDFHWRPEDVGRAAEACAMLILAHAPACESLGVTTENFMVMHTVRVCMCVCVRTTCDAQYINSNGGANRRRRPQVVRE